MPVRPVIASILLLFLAVGAGPSCPAPCSALQQEADLQWALAENLSGRGEHYRAITEYERFIFYFPRDSRVGLARIRVLESYVAGRWWPEALKAAREVLEDQELSQGFRCRAMELLGICYMRMKDPVKARESFRSALELCAEPADRDRIRLLAAELGAGLRDWEAAAQALEAMEAGGLPGQAAQEQASRIKRGELSSKERSPWTAGVLAGLFPGAGHAYLGRWEDAALVFLVNGAFLGATVEAVQKKEPALAAGMALAELLWYSGNIFSAVSNAHKHNRRLSEQWSRELGSEQGLPGESRR